MLILREKCLVLWNIAPLAAERRLETACKCSKLKPVQMPQMQTLTACLICEYSGSLITISRLFICTIKKSHTYYSTLRYDATVHTCANSNLNLQD